MAAAAKILLEILLPSSSRFCGLLNKPELAKSMVVYGSTSCWEEGATECVNQTNILQVLNSRAFLLRLLGTAIEATLVEIVSKCRTPTLQTWFFYPTCMDQKVKTPKVWFKNCKAIRLFGQIRNITPFPFLQIAGEHEEPATGSSKHSMQLEASRIPKAEPSPIALEDREGKGYSHVALFEYKDGLDLFVKHLAAFYNKRA